jgi:TRAP-type uncharacterized transport system substrate-binding protein
VKLRLAIGSHSSGTQAVTAALLLVSTGRTRRSLAAIGWPSAPSMHDAGELDAAFFVGPAENALINLAANSNYA